MPKNNEEKLDQTDDMNNDVKPVDGTSADTSDDKQDDKSAKNEDTEKTFTQSEVSKMMSKEKHQGRDAALRALGIDPNNTSLIELVKGFVEDNKQEAAKSDNTADSDADAALRDELARTKALVEVMKAGVKSQYADDAVELMLSKTLSSDVSVDEMLSEYKKKYPLWFAVNDLQEDNTSDDDDIPGKKLSGTGSTPAASRKKPNGANQEGLGKRLAASRKKSSKKSSYWN